MGLQDLGHCEFCGTKLDYKHPNRMKRFCDRNCQLNAGRPAQRANALLDQGHLAQLSGLLDSVFPKWDLVKQANTAGDNDWFLIWDACDDQADQKMKVTWEQARAIYAAQERANEQGNNNDDD